MIGKKMFRMAGSPGVGWWMEEGTASVAATAHTEASFPSASKT